MKSQTKFSESWSEEQSELLLSFNHDITVIRQKEQILPVLQHYLTAIGFYNDIHITVFNDDKSFSAYLLNPESNRPEFAAYNYIVTTRHPYPDGFFELVFSGSGVSVFNLDELIQREGTPGYIRHLHNTGIKEVVGVPLTDEVENIGGLFMFGNEIRNFNDSQFKFVKKMAAQLGIAVSNIRAHEAQKKEAEEKAFLLSLSIEIAKITGRNGLLSLINSKIGGLFNITHCGIGIIDDSSGEASSFLINPSSPAAADADSFAAAFKNFDINQDNILSTVLKSAHTTVFDLERENIEDRLPDVIKINFQLGIKEMVATPLLNDGEVFGLFCLFSERPGTFKYNDLNMLEGIGSLISICVSNITAYEKIQRQLSEINRYKKQLEKENFYLNEQLKTIDYAGEIIGSSQELEKTRQLIAKVSSTDTTVLILGESGTGKELVARALHKASPRSGQIMIKLNCAALPVSLIESELFGHEKGSFTGASERRIGKFELAHKSTLFLDEIGELSPELQSKLLRAIQEREIERIGGRGVIKIDVRIIAATNRDLVMEMENGRFRSDLFYRLNVFPITVPPLRERQQDIPLLVKHFIGRLSKKLGRPVTGIAPHVLENMMNYPWPGNIRELEHTIEKSVLMAGDTTINDVFLPQKGSNATIGRPEAESLMKSLDQNERDHIISVLKLTNGKIKGPDAAAEMLGLPSTTLNSRIKKLGISKIDFYARPQQS